MKKYATIFAAVILFVTCFWPLSKPSAQWVNDPNVNSLICDAERDQMSPHMCSDGSGGVIIAWWDNRNLVSNSDIYIQRVDAQGYTQWPKNGIEICNASGQQTSPRIVSDDSGGAVIIWRDYRDGSNTVAMYGQQVNGAGETQWTANGVQLSSTTNHKRWPHICTDGSGGAIVTWEEQGETAVLYDVRVQRINSSGDVLWGSNGVLVYNDQSTPSDQEYPHITADGSGGCIVTWQDERGGGGIPLIYAQRFNSAGSLQWGSSAGVKLSTDASEWQNNPYIIGDGSANFIIAWYDYRNGVDYDIYAQKLNSSGVRQWTDSAVLVCSATGHQAHPQLVTDGSGGAIITWYDDFYGTSSDIYVQKVNNAGVIQWLADGVPICTATSDQETNDYKYETIVSDGEGGAIISWWDKRSGSRSDIYAQRINGAGDIQWTADGIPVCTAEYGQYNPTMLTDGNAGAFIIWMDYRILPSVYDIYMQRIFSDGAFTPVELASFTAQASSGSVILKWEAVTGQDNCGFEIERKPVTKNVWENIGFVEGRGNSNSLIEYTFQDSNPVSGVVSYRIGKTNADGSNEYSNTIELKIPEQTGPELLQNYPNPFNPSTIIEYRIPSEAFVELIIYDILGNNIKVLISKKQSPGTYKFGLDASDFASGIYFYKLTCDKVSRTKKMIILK